MARIYPFRALRYDPARVNMEDVVTQPYDKITPAMQQRYYEASPYNLIRVILGKHFENDTEIENVYTRAADTLRSWRKDHILAEESEPALYGYSQTYTVPHTEEIRERRGFIALGHLYDYADKVVYRHEQTFPKHKSDRMSPLQGHPRLLRADLHALLRPRLHRGKAHLRRHQPQWF